MAFGGFLSFFLYILGVFVIEILKRGGQTDFFTEEKVRKVLMREAEGLSYVDLDRVLEIVNGNVYAGMSTAELYDTLILAVTSLFEEDPAYDKLASRLFLKKIYKEVAHKTIKNDAHYRQLFVENIKAGVAEDIYDKRLLDFNLEELTRHLCVERDSLLKYMGLRTLYERYFVQMNNRRSETPQAFWMRVAMGLAILEENKEEKALEFYEAISQLFIVPSTPTLFHSGLIHSQLFSCFLNYVDDDLHHIFKVFGDNAQMSKYSGGIGTHWTKVRGTGALINSTRVDSQGVIPFLKIMNDTTLAISRSGKRRGAACAYCELWHYDIEDFIDLRKNTGDERRRTHDMNTALWIPDLFMQRVQEDGYWTLFSPDEVPDLPEIYGAKFKKKYEEYEEMAKQGKIKLYKRLKAKDLWKKAITSLFESGHAWINWKDPSNIRSPQQHVGVIHGSNLCCVAGDQRVPTLRGMLTVKELYDLGEENVVVGQCKHQNASEMIMPRPNAPMVKIKTLEGYSHKVTPDHKIWVKTSKDSFSYKKAEDLQEGDKIALQCFTGLFGPEDNRDKITDDLRQTEKVPDFIWRSNRETVESYLDYFQRLYCMNKKHLEDLQILALNLDKPTRIFSGDTAFGGISCYWLEVDNDNKNYCCTFTEIEELPAEDAYCLQVYNNDHLWVCNGILTKNTEILENTSKEETACCSLSSINLSRFANERKEINWGGIRSAVKTAIRMLDNSIDIAFYPTKEGRNSHLKHRPLGFGQMGWQDMLYKMDIEFESEKAQTLTDQLNEFISYYAITTSMELAQERGAYGSFEGSNWSKGIFPLDTIEHLERERGEPVLVNRESRLDWDALKEKVIQNGMRNSLTCAVAPTACTTGTTLIETIDGFKSLYKILESQHVDWQKVEESGVSQWIFLEPFELPTLHSDDICNKIWYNGLQPVYKVTFEDDTYFEFTGNHQLLLTKHGFDIFTFVKDIQEGDMGVGRYGNIAVKSIEKIGLKHTWDIETVRTHHYLLSNGIVSHNTISNISGCFPSIEPAFANMYVKSNRNGEFTVINSYLVEDLKDLGLWGREMIDKIKLHNGSIQQIKEIPLHIRRKYKTAFEVDTKKANISNALRSKWIDQSQSYNIFYDGKSGKALSDIYFDAWRRGIKTTYYLRTTSDQKAEKATLSLSQTHGEQARSCSIDNPECESCQ
jgi:ribonucleotide reductase alpha subunit